MISNIKEMLLDLGYSNITEDGLNYRMKPIYRESGNNTVLSVRKDSGYFIDFEYAAIKLIAFIGLIFGIARDAL